MKTIAKFKLIPAAIILTCSFFLLFLLSISCSKEDETMNISSQSKEQAVQKSKNTGHKTILKTVYVWDGYYMDVYCNGEVIDHLIGAPTITEIQFYEDGNLIGWNNHYVGEVKSEKTGEVFTIHENDKTRDFNNTQPMIIGTTSWHFNLKGNMGHHYVGSMSYDWETGNDTPLKTTKITCL